MVYSPAVPGDSALLRTRGNNAVHAEAGIVFCKWRINSPSPMTADVMPQNLGPMSTQYSLRYFSDWGGPCLWANNDAARSRFGIGGVNFDDLPVSDATKRSAEELVAWHVQSLNKDYPPDPSPWRQEECDRFNHASQQLLHTVRNELGADYDVVDEQLPISQDPNLDEYLKDPLGYRKS